MSKWINVVTSSNILQKKNLTKQQDREHFKNVYMMAKNTPRLLFSGSFCLIISDFQIFRPERCSKCASGASKLVLYEIYTKDIPYNFTSFDIPNLYVYNTCI
jgi:hypothetical protein